jgi:antitoxin component of MazEF toxin-antitoxin module
VYPTKASKETQVLTKLVGNQITLPPDIIQMLGSVEYFEIAVEGGQVILTPVKVQRADAVREKLAELDITEQDVADAVTWAREGTAP